MQIRLLHVFLFGMALALSPAGAFATNWTSLAGVSDTLEISPSRLCVGADARKTLGCPSYAPSLTTAGDVSVTGNLSAAKFIGDGSGLTGLSSAADRITSGTSSIIVNSATSSISFTTAGTERMTVTSAGNVGIGTTVPIGASHRELHLAAVVRPLLV